MEDKRSVSRRKAVLCKKRWHTVKTERCLFDFHESGFHGIV